MRKELEKLVPTEFGERHGEGGGLAQVILVPFAIIAYGLVITALLGLRSIQDGFGYAVLALPVYALAMTFVFLGPSKTIIRGIITVIIRAMPYAFAITLVAFAIKRETGR